MKFVHKYFRSVVLVIWLMPLPHFRIIDKENMNCLHKLFRFEYEIIVLYWVQLIHSQSFNCLQIIWMKIKCATTLTIQNNGLAIEGATTLWHVWDYLEKQIICFQQWNSLTLCTPIHNWFTTDLVRHGYANLNLTWVRY